MRRKLSIHVDTMALMLVLWLCSLPVIGLVVLPLFGRTVAFTTALVLLPVFLLICWGICSWHLVKNSSS